MIDLLKTLIQIFAAFAQIFKVVVDFFGSLDEA